ncbi:Cystathionine gamma-lyase [Hondaea fermentalgiana]|uniref:plant cystathionine gamma-synthase n=1 Tax=Hondaea fermentalgiana TaxID=2315210 RepID=A0A2R5GMJ7_9STRA|nr:Cystathionine gamma-lyase [Hondaea fermentalgiana]|eukprot:GBG32106.1 Cystathionine gamma-lyase [Hondaea fermentalgiana]
MQRPNVDANGGAGTWDDKEYGLSTDVVHGTVVPDAATGAILTPIFQSTTFVQDSVDQYLAKGYSYSRTGNPTVRALEHKVAFLEKGAGAACFSTGMAATVSVMTGFLKQGDHCVLTNVSYGGTNRVTRKMFQDLGISFSYVDFTDPANVEAAIQDNTKLVFSETPSNPLMTLTDLQAVSDICKSKGVLHVCDATFATPIIMRPLDFGCDLAIQSLTKFYDGHNMTVGGAVISSTPELDERVHFMQNMHGNIMAPQTAFLVLQTLKTMEVRVLRQSATAAKVAEFLEKHPKVDVVRYPGLASHPQKELADRQHRNGVHGSMLWCELKGGFDAGKGLMDTVQRPWSLCENLGSCESNLTHAASMTHGNVAREERLSVGLTDGLVRLSIGLEDPDDLIAALGKALDKL